MTFQTLISVFPGTINNEQVLLCDARDLHDFLEVGRRFTTWIVERIAEYGFVENQDFMSFSQNGEKPKGGRPTKEYHLTLDTAKELAMVERNDQGRAVRQYFIECEKRLRDAKLAPAPTITTAQYQELHRKVFTIMTLFHQQESARWWAWRALRDLPGAATSATNLPAACYGDALRRLDVVYQEAQTFSRALREAETRFLKRGFVTDPGDMCRIAGMASQRCLELR